MKSWVLFGKRVRFERYPGGWCLTTRHPLTYRTLTYHISPHMRSLTWCVYGNGPAKPPQFWWAIEIRPKQ